MKEKHEWLYRAIRTFIQAAIGYAAVALPTVNWEDTSVLKTTLVGIGISAVSAGISAIMNADWNHKEG